MNDVVNDARIRVAAACCALLLLLGQSRAAVAQGGAAQQTGRAPGPRLHHVGLNSVDPARAIEWYLRVWPAARRTEVAGYPAVEGEMLVVFNKVDRPPPGA